MGDNRSQKRMGGRVRNRSRSKVQDKIRGKVQSKVRSVVRNAFEQGILDELKADLLKEVLGIEAVVPAAPVEKPKKPRESKKSKTGEGSATRKCPRCGLVKPMNEFRTMKALCLDLPIDKHSSKTCRACRNIPTSKICSYCGEEQPLAEFYASYGPKNHPSRVLLRRCKTCREALQSGEKLCNICGEWLPLSDFSTRKLDTRITHRSTCKTCTRTKTRTCSVCGKEKRISSFGDSKVKCIACTSHAYNQRCSQSLTDSYVNTALKLRASETSPEVIEAKREQILLYRELKALKTQLTKEVGNGTA